MRRSLLLAVICLLSATRQTRAVGLGEKLMHEEGALLGAEVEAGGESGADSIFLQEDSSAERQLQDEHFVGLIRRLQVEVVAPSKDLAKMMNEASTRSRAMFLHQYERYFEDSELASVRRPMLLTYLGLELADEKHIKSWYEAHRRRLLGKILRSCKNLLAQRGQLRAGQREADAELHKMMEGDQANKFHRAYLIFQNNLNLFMLENYLLLCSRLEPERLSEELEQSGFLFRKEAP